MLFANIVLLAKYLPAFESFPVVSHHTLLYRVLGKRERVNNEIAQANRKKPKLADGSTPKKRSRRKGSGSALKFLKDTQFVTERDNVANWTKLNEESISVFPLQRVTFTSRREFILAGLDPTHDILEENPVLRLPFAVSKVFPGVFVLLLAGYVICIDRSSLKWT